MAGDLIRCVSGIPSRRFATQKRDDVQICEFNSAGATPLPAHPSARCGGLSIVVLLWLLDRPTCRDCVPKRGAGVFGSIALFGRTGELVELRRLCP